MHVGEPQEFYEPVDRFNERWLELDAPSGPPPAGRPLSELRHDDGGARPALRAPSRDHLHRGPHGMARQRPRTPRRPARSAPERRRRDRRHPLRARPAAAHGTGVLHRAPGPRAVREGTASRPTSFRTTGGPSRPPTSTSSTTARYHAFWRLYGMDLPDDVLRKVYYGNALRVIPGISRARVPAARHRSEPAREGLADRMRGADRDVSVVDGEARGRARPRGTARATIRGARRRRPDNHAAAA